MKFLERAATAAAVGGLMASAMVLAAPASADLPSGNYTRTLTDNGGAPLRVGATTPWILSSCGADCVRVHQAADPEWDADLHLQGNAFAGAMNEHRFISIDKDSLVITENLMTSKTTYVVLSQLTKN